jgi:hypothetical protein
VLIKDFLIKGNRKPYNSSQSTLRITNCEKCEMKERHMNTLEKRLCEKDFKKMTSMEEEA